LLARGFEPGKRRRVSRESNRRWFAIDCSADSSPPLFRLRNQAGPLADVYYYRAVAFCKLYAPDGQLENSWPDLAAYLRWPDAPEELRDLCRACGVVSPPRDRLYLWFESNGWILRQKAADAAAHRQKRTDDKRRALAARKARALKRDPTAGLGCRSVGRSVGCTDKRTDKNQTSPDVGRRTKTKKGKP
jgi:hypothetical protein